MTSRECPARQQAVPSSCSAQNPYTHFRSCCTVLNTKEHAQLCGVLSFSMFLCLVVISLMLFGALSIFYIITGVIVFSLLMKSLFGAVDKLAILFYLLFEAIQIGFYLALILYIALPMIFVQVPTVNCYNKETVVNGTVTRREFCETEYGVGSSYRDYAEVLFFVVLLVAIKMYFARVFAHFYKYLAWNERSCIERAMYFNGRGCQITVDQLFPPPPPGFWENHVVRDKDYGYNVANVGQLPVMELPSYAQVVGEREPTKEQRKTTPQLMSGNDAGGVTSSSNNSFADNGQSGKGNLNAPDIV